MTPRAWVPAAAVALVVGCSTGADPEPATPDDPLADGCAVVEQAADGQVDLDDAAAVQALADRLTAEADALSTSDAAELRPLAGAAAVVARTPPGPDAEDVRDDYRRTLDATAAVCAAAASASS